MKDRYRVVIAGAGPAGCILARDLARAGVPVTVFEKGASKNLGHDWSDAVERSALEGAGFSLPPDGTVHRGPRVKSTGGDPGRSSGIGAKIDPAERIFEEHGYPEMEVWAPDYSCAKKIQFRYITTDRRALGRLLAREAEDAGAEIRYRHEVTGLLSSDTAVTGVRVKDADTDSEHDESADVVVDAAGFAGALRFELPENLPTARELTSPFRAGDFARVFRTVRERRTDVEDDLRDHYRYGYHTGYQWVQYLNDREIDVGAGIGDDPANPDPREIVEEFISRHSSISDREVRGGGGRCLVGRSPYSLVTSGFLIVGDSAGQTIPMTGCGAGGAMAGARLAAKTLIRAAETGRNDITALWPYGYGWFVESERGSSYAGLSALKNSLQSLSHEEISFLFRRDILDARMLTASINGAFLEPGLKDTLKALVRGIARPGVLMKLNTAISLGKRIHRHYRRYPKEYHEDSFATWTEDAREIFGAPGEEQEDALPSA
jgi:digeranylgeranylglycerophospholipid reductase